jgi:hypothetical protein
MPEVASLEEVVFVTETVREMLQGMRQWRIGANETS